MKPSFSRFLIYLNDSDLRSEEIESLHDLIFLNKSRNTITARDLTTASHTIFIERSFKILNDMADKGVIERDEILCPSCGQKLEFNDIIDSQCYECEAILELPEMVSFSIDGVLTEQEVKILSRNAFERNKAEAIADYWERNGQITYLLTDLVNSQKIQAQGDDEYSNFLKTLRMIWKYKILSQMDETFLILGEIGDAYKIAFTNVEDAFKAIKLFAIEIEENAELNDFPSIKKKINFFPKFTAVLDNLPRPTDSKGQIFSPKDVISVTLNGVYDFSTARLTDLFRLESASAIYYNNYELYDVSLWVFFNALEELKELHEKKIEDKNLAPISAKKKGAIVSKGKAALFFLKGMKLEIASNPQELLSDSP